MSARWPCFICGEETHDASEVEVDGFRRGSNPWTCAKHVAELITAWRRLFPGTGMSHTEGGGLELTWDDLQKIVNRFERDVALRVHRYEITDKEARLGAFMKEKGL